MAAFYQTFPTTSARTNECAPEACPECGGLECLCRPRFFAGQLLTDEDLNLLDRYIVNKGKLRNRYLHGWGVVCGLEAICHPCNAVTVRAGYALSPCGEDIIVCADQVVDVCSLIKKCRDNERRRRECEPFGTLNQTGDGNNVDEEWILSVRYEETASRGVMSLKGGSAGSSCGCGSQTCGCGGSSSSCGCGCRGGAKKKGAGSCGCSTAVAKKKSAPPQCEPTVTCEGFVFEVCRVTPAMKREQDGKAQGAITSRLIECLKDFIAAMPKQPSANEGKAAWQQWSISLKEALLDYFASHPVYDCLLAEKIAQFIPPDPNQFQTTSQYQAAVKSEVEQKLAVVAAEYILYCACSSILPPCPAPVEDPRVPLATITVRRGDCRIVRVCNLSYRKFATTFPNLQYWLSFIPFVRQFRRALARLCCRGFEQKPDATTPQPTPQPLPTPGAATINADALNQPPSSFNTVEANAEAREVSALGDNNFLKIFARAWERKTETIDARTIFMAATDARDANNQPYMNEAELADPLSFLMLNQVARPIFASVPDETPDLLKCIVEAGRVVCGKRTTTVAPSDTDTLDRASAARAEEASEAKDLATLRAQLAELQQTVKSQQSKIEELDGRLRGEKQ